MIKVVTIVILVVKIITIIEVDAEQAYFKRESNTPMVEEVDNDDVVEVDAAEVYSKRAGKEPMTQHPSEDKDVTDSSDSGGGDGERSGLEDEDVVNHAEREFVEDNSDSWDGSDEDVTEPVQMGAGIINSDYESEELHSLEESSSDDDFGDDTNDGSEDELRTPVGKGRGQKGPSHCLSQLLRLNISDLRKICCSQYLSNSKKL